MQVQVIFNDKYSKYDGVVNGKVVTRCASESKCADALRKQGYEVGATEGETQPVVKIEQLFNINEKFSFIESFVKMIATKVHTSLIVCGSGGLGKTHTVTTTLEKLGMKECTGVGESGDFILVKGHSSAKGLYRCLFENNGKTIVFDDCDSVFKDPVGANVLKSALDSNERRVISWNVEMPEKDDLPRMFEFKGRVIFISNLPLHKIPQAIISRGLRVDLTMNVQEKVERIATVVASEDFMPEYDAAMKNEVVDFIRENAHRATDLNLRTAINIAKIRASMGAEWKKAALYMTLS